MIAFNASWAIVSSQTNPAQFKDAFQHQFEADPPLGVRVSQILHEYFSRSTLPELLVYEEFLVADRALDGGSRRDLEQEIERAYQTMRARL